MILTLRPNHKLPRVSVDKAVSIVVLISAMESQKRLQKVVDDRSFCQEWHVHVCWWCEPTHPLPLPQSIHVRSHTHHTSCQTHTLHGTVLCCVCTFIFRRTIRTLCSQYARAPEDSNLRQRVHNFDPVVHDGWQPAVVHCKIGQPRHAEPCAAPTFLQCSVKSHTMTGNNLYQRIRPNLAASSRSVSLASKSPTCSFAATTAKMSACPTTCSAPISSRSTSAEE